jgi:hypothetical protein
VIEHLEVRLLEKVRIRIILVQWRYEERVDAEERTELRDEVLLLNICARGWWHPELLGVTLNQRQ